MYSINRNSETLLAAVGSQDTTGPMTRDQLKDLAILGKSGVRMEMPGCSLRPEGSTLGVCMGNQAQIRKGSTAMSTSTRNFPNRLGIDTFVYLGSAELASICALMGKIPTVAEYMEQVKVVNAKAADVYRYMNFDKIAEFKELADTVTV